MSVYPFTEEELKKASEEWGCNCGPAAFAFALRVSLDRARELIAEFDEKGYTSPAMMRRALERAGRPYRALPIEPLRGNLGDVPFDLSLDRPALVRVQWHGPWTTPGANAKWAYTHTHWICCFGRMLLFDVNGGAMEFARWNEEIAPELMRMNRRRDGKYSLTHVWVLEGVA